MSINEAARENPSQRVSLHFSKLPARGVSRIIGTQGGVLSIEFKVNLLKPAVGASLRCVSATLRAGRTIAVVESEVYTVSEGREALCAKATVTLAVVAPA
jgi:acyl-coenzyme A thioesterase PaaI-like protein